MLLNEMLGISAPRDPDRRFQLREFLIELDLPVLLRRLARAEYQHINILFEGVHVPLENIKAHGTVQPIPLQFFRINQYWPPLFLGSHILVVGFAFMICLDICTAPPFDSKTACWNKPSAKPSSA